MTESRDQRLDDAVEARLERLREASAGIAPRADFTARVVAAAAALPPRRRLWGDIARAWWSVPAAVALASAALAWALHTRADVERLEAARDVESALSYPTGAALW